MAEYKGAAKEGARAMALMKKREKMKADIEAAKNKISEVCFSLREFGFFWVNFALIIMIMKMDQMASLRCNCSWILFLAESQDCRY